MAETKAQAWMITDEDLQELEGLLKELRDRVDKAHDDGRIYMMQQYTTLVATVSSEVRKVRNRFDRESIAAMRRAHKELKLNARGEASDEEE